MKAIAYVSDMPLLRPGIVVSREYQKSRIEEHAREQGIEIIAFFEDRNPQGPVLDRPGLRAALRFEGEWDMFLVERVWCVARVMVELRPVLNLLDRRGARLLAATELWDLLSQKVRGRYRRKPVAGPECRSTASAQKVVDARPGAPAFSSPLFEVVLPGRRGPAGTTQSSQLPA